MIEVDDKKFEELVAKAIDAIPEPYGSHLQNVAFIVEDLPSPEQQQRLSLHPGELLFGLYEGVPLPQRGGVSKLLPDKITVFKMPLQYVSRDLDDLKRRLNNTVWHEVAHYYGLDHKRIHELEAKAKPPQSDA